MQQIRSKTLVRHFSRNAVDLGRWHPPTRRVVNADGEMVIEKVPSIPHAKMLHPQGHTVNLPLHNGMGRPIENDPYKMHTLQVKLGKGWLPFGSCPKYHGLHQWLPEGSRDSAPCDLDASGKRPVDDNHPCSCIVATMKARQGANNRQMAELERKYQTQQQRDAQRQDETIGKLADVVQVMREATEERRSNRRSDK